MTYDLNNFGHGSAPLVAICYSLEQEIAGIYRKMIEEGATGKDIRAISAYIAGNIHCAEAMAVLDYQAKEYKERTAKRGTKRLPE